MPRTRADAAERFGLHLLLGHIPWELRNRGRVLATEGEKYATAVACTLTDRRRQLCTRSHDTAVIRRWSSNARSRRGRRIRPCESRPQG